jgi:hypothetical protein
MFSSVLILRNVLNLFPPITLLSLNSNLCQKSKYLFNAKVTTHMQHWESNGNSIIPDGDIECICQLCHIDVEDEFHFLMNCDKLIHERVILFRNIFDIVPSFTTMSDGNSSQYILSTYNSQHNNNNIYIDIYSN